MTAPPLLLVLSVLSQAGSGAVTGHDSNPIYRELQAHGLSLGGSLYEFPAPAIQDGMTAEAHREAFEGVAGSKRRADDLLRNSVTAPFLLKLRDLPAEGGATLRAIDLWFVVHADLDAIDPGAVGPGVQGSKPVSAGNMTFTGGEVAPDDLKARGIEPPVESEPGRAFPAEGYAHATADLLGRIEVEATSHVFATATAESIVIASRTDPAFDGPGPAPNFWRALKGADETAHPYEGGGGYARIGRYEPVPGALLVEVHAVFIEPNAWFDGNPILRSKFSLVARDRIRALRRELVAPATPDR